MASNDYKVDAFDPADEKYDAERRGSAIGGGRKMSRIGPPPGMQAGNENDGLDEHSKLMAMEADNAIKYRTCSWQKVSLRDTNRWHAQGSAHALWLRFLLIS